MWRHISEKNKEGNTWLTFAFCIGTSEHGEVVIMCNHLFVYLLSQETSSDVLCFCLSVSLSNRQCLSVAYPRCPRCTCIRWLRTPCSPCGKLSPLAVGLGVARQTVTIVCLSFSANCRLCHFVALETTFYNNLLLSAIGCIVAGQTPFNNISVCVTVCLSLSVFICVCLC